MNKFWERDLDPGYYDKVLKAGLISGKGIQTNWHNITLLNVKQYIENNMKHLDYACGPGTLIGKYSHADSIGVDIAEQQIEYAKSQYEDKGLFVNTKNFSFDNYEEYFDVVTVLGLIEFLSDSEIIELVKKIYKSLKPGGELILTTPNFNSLIYPLSEILGIVNWSGEHKNKFNKKKIKKVFGNSPFEIVGIKKILNIGMLFSIFSIKIGIFIEKIFGRIILNSQGFVFIVQLKK
jgi:2-polyprenyl-3-methyl-5-hydroxy-6-metoxy-1,4-benzoquinol methylase